MNKNRFKFRVWDDYNKYYIENVCGFYKDNGSTTIISNKGHSTTVAFDSRYIIEQCTGLKDSTGKLIFEGDKILIPSYHDEPLIAIYDNGGFWGHSFGYNHFCFAFSFGDVEDEIKIIGNIHETEEE